MALYLFALLSVSTAFFLGPSIEGINHEKDLHEQSLSYTVEKGLSDGIRPEVILLDEGAHRQRRYVPELGPLEEYTQHHNRLLTEPIRDKLLADNMPNNRQTKETKFLKPDVPEAITDNSAMRLTTTIATTTTVATVTTPSHSAATSLNKSVIVSADFYNDNGVTNRRTDEDDIDVDRHTDVLINKTMTQNNITERQEDYHVYYNSTFTVNPGLGRAYWVDMNTLDNVKINHMLSKSHRRAVTVRLSFDFPFYGHMVRNVTVATGGFLYTGEYVHSWLAATQYIAPLMANFDTSISNESYIKYVDNGTALTVQWEKVILQDKPSAGEFTFQATVHSTGNIVFVYQNLPIAVENIENDLHPVKVGISDAYIIDRTIFFVKRKTIYEYHRVNFNKVDIKNWTVIHLDALPTCTEKKDCHSCLTADIGFECKWCMEVGRCSTGMDRKRHDWLNNLCDNHQVSTVEQCQEHSQSAAIHRPNTAVPIAEAEVRHGGSSFLGISFIMVLISTVAVWAVYAYRNPHSTSGQILIKYRPSQWMWRRREAGYTAATIHM